jgi:hypothetical protein
MSFFFSFTEDVNVGEMLKQDLQFHFHIQLLQQTQVQSMPFMLPRRQYLWHGGLRKPGNDLEGSNRGTV